MGDIIKMSDRVKKPIPPKTFRDKHGGQEYICVFDPNAPKERQWVWTVNYVRTYRYFGSGPSLEHVSASARKKIHSLNKRVIEYEEEIASRGVKDE